MAKGLGLRHAPDMRDGAHLIGPHIRVVATVLPSYHTWQIGNILDQGFEGSCVGHGWTAWENAKPGGFERQQQHPYAVAWYERAKELDEWWGTNYEGTSVRAGAKVAQERGFLSEYLWATGTDDMDAWLLLRSPLVIGCKWFNSMDGPDADGFLTVDTSSGVRGGHCVLLYGKGRAGNYQFQNSWGYDYAKEGTFRLTPENLQRLIGAGQFVACAAVQTGEA